MNRTWVNNPTWDLATAREETRRVYLQSTYLQHADFIICTHPYLLAYLLDEVPERRQPVFLFWQGGSLLEYLHQDLHAWVQTKLVAWRTRTLFVMNSLDHYWLKRTVGHATFLPFGARHMPRVLQKQLGQIYSVRKSKQVLLHRWEFILQESELARLTTLMAYHYAHGQKMTGHDLRVLLNPFDLWQLVNFEAIVLFPWNLEITTFLEFYSLNIPLFVPDSTFMSVVVWRYLANPLLQIVHRFTTVRQEWWKGASCHLQPSPEECASSTMATPSKWLMPPWLEFEDEMPLYPQIHAWWQETEYVKMPHVQVFTGVANLLQELRNVDTDSIVARMRETNLANQRKSSKIYEAMLQPWQMRSV